MNVDHLSLSTTPILLRRGDEAVSQGTGFFFAHDFEIGPVIFLVTNFHVLTGHAPLEDSKPIGDNIEFQIHRSKDNPKEIKPIRAPLFPKDNTPIWISPKEFPNADVAIIPIPGPTTQDLPVWTLSSGWASKDIKVRPTSAVTLIGYPYGFYDTANSLPVWKTGHIASEPDVDFEDEPSFLVDVSSFPGMSGAPVLAISHGTYEREDGHIMAGRGRRFLGIYASQEILEEHRFLEELPTSSRPGIKTEESLQLAHVWKSQLIVDTITGLDLERYHEETWGGGQNSLV